ncbi:MAG: sugar transporter [Polaromonas sp.]|nr:MAG: sugar transporter [Polaromonas sp.]
MRHTFAVLLPTALLGLASLAGCGQKGPLFIAVPTVPIPAAAKSDTPAPLPAATASAPLARQIQPAQQ